jgi:uncharacterized protein YdhG (YjbR/CyaY superfamily)
MRIGLLRNFIMKKRNKKSAAIKPGGIDEYIADRPEQVRGRLAEMRAAIQAVAPDAMETVSYFDIPGYSYEGYDYNGMFAWFSFKAPFVRLHVRPQALVDNKKQLEGYPTTKAVVSFPIEKPIPKALVKNLVKASLKSMKEMAE